MYVAHDVYVLAMVRWWHDIELAYLDVNGLAAMWHSKLGHLSALHYAMQA